MCRGLPDRISFRPYIITTFLERVEGSFGKGLLYALWVCNVNSMRKRPK